MPARAKSNNELRLVVQEESEAEIQKQIMNALLTRGWLVVRINGLGGKFEGRGGKGQYVSSYIIHGLDARSGFPDVVAFRGDGQGSGRFLLIEVKDRKGRLNDNQKKFIEFAERFKVEVHVCRSWQQALDIVEKLQVRISEKLRYLAGLEEEVAELREKWGMADREPAVPVTTDVQASGHDTQSWHARPLGESTPARGTSRAGKASRTPLQRVVTERR